LKTDILEYADEDKKKKLKKYTQNLCELWAPLKDQTYKSWA
jgi:hypothetical protein